MCEDSELNKSATKIGVRSGNWEDSVRLQRHKEVNDQLSEILVLQAKISTDKQTKKPTLIRLTTEAAEKAIENEEEEVAHELVVHIIANAKDVREREDQAQVIKDTVPTNRNNIQHYSYISGLQKNLKKKC